VVLTRQALFNADQATPIIVMGDRAQQRVSCIMPARKTPVMDVAGYPRLYAANVRQEALAVYCEKTQSIATCTTDPFSTR